MSIPEQLEISTSLVVVEVELGRSGCCRVKSLLAARHRDSGICCVDR